MRLGRFEVGTFSWDVMSLDILYLGRFAAWMLCLGTFCIGTFLLDNIYRKSKGDAFIYTLLYCNAYFKVKSQTLGETRKEPEYFWKEG